MENVFEPMNFAGNVFEPTENFDGNVFEPMNFLGKKKSVKKPSAPVSTPAPAPAPAPAPTPATETPVIATETPANEKAEPNKKIFGMPRKVVLGVGIGLVVVGVTSFFLLRKKK